MMIMMAIRSSSCQNINKSKISINNLRRVHWIWMRLTVFIEINKTNLMIKMIETKAKISKGLNYIGLFVRLLE